MIYLVTGNTPLFSDKECPYTVIGVEESLKLLAPLSIVGLDTETEGFSPFLKTLLLLQLGNRDFQVVIDCTTIDITKYKDYLESDRLFIGWNLKFDVKFLFYHGIIPKRLYDGFLAEKMRWLGYPSGMHSLSLKSAGENYLGVELDKSVRGQIIWRKTLTDEIIVYAANDVKYLEDIMDKQLQILEERGQLNAIDLENRAILPTAYFEYCGVKLDQEAWQKKMRKDQETLRQVQEELDSFVVDLYETHKNNLEGFWVDDWYDFSLGAPKGRWKPAPVTETTPSAPSLVRWSEDWRYISREFPFVEIAQPDLFGFTKAGPKCTVNWNSQKQVIPLLEFFGFNLLVPDKEKGGMKKSVEADVIEGQKEVHPISSVYLRFKAAQKVTSTYGQNFLDLINPKTRRLHTSFNQIGTDTHRYSSGGGNDLEVIPGKKVPLVNLQNIPADSATRSCFVAEPGNKWISIDFSSEESVILANISQDPAMLQIFREKGDLHSLVAKMVFPEELEGIDVKDIKKKRPDLRKKAKAPEFVFSYGGNADTLIGRDHIPREKALEIEKNYRKGFKGVDAYQKRQRSLVMQLGYINTCPEVGFRAYIYDFEELSKTQAKFNNEFWDQYRKEKESNPSSPLVQEVKHYLKRKSASERQSINYPIQSRASAIYKIAAVNMFNWVVKNGYFGIVKFCIPVHDEFNIEAPEEIAEIVAKEMYDCMIHAGKIICTIIPLDADISRLDSGELPTHWIHE